MRTSRLLPSVFCLLLLLASPAAAQITIPFTFSDGTVILSAQVNANFTALGNGALNRTGGTMTGVLKLPDGAVGAPSLAVSAEPTTGFYRIGAGTLGLAILGANMVTVSGAGVAWGGGAAVASSDAIAGAVLTTGAYADPAWITSLAATKLSGTVADARLSANVPLKNGANVFSGSNTFTGGVGVGTTLAMNAGTGHDVALAGHAIIIMTAGAPATLTGFAGGTAGRLLLIVNNTGGAVSIPHENAGSVAANRFKASDGASAVNIGNNFTTTLIYDGTAQRWRTF